MTQFTDHIKILIARHFSQRKAAPAQVIAKYFALAY
jgi:hypothetical protein